MFERLCDTLHREMEIIEDKYADGKTPMTAQDLEHIDKIAHALKCLATYEAMKGCGEEGSYAKIKRYRRY